MDRVKVEPLQKAHAGRRLGRATWTAPVQPQVIMGGASDAQWPDGRDLLGGQEAGPREVVQGADGGGERAKKDDALETAAALLVRGLFAKWMWPLGCLLQEGSSACHLIRNSVGEHLTVSKKMLLSIVILQRISSPVGLLALR